MAVYPYFCQECGKEEEVIQSISSYCVAPIRPACCAKTMERRMTLPMVQMDMPNWGGYVSPIDGTFIDSKSKERDHKEQHGVVHLHEVEGHAAAKKAERAAAARKELKADLVESAHKVEAGYKPQLESVAADGSVIPA